MRRPGYRHHGTAVDVGGTVVARRDDTFVTIGDLAIPGADGIRGRLAVRRLAAPLANLGISVAHRLTLLG
jgi:hypothetical protein